MPGFFGTVAGWILLLCWLAGYDFNLRPMVLIRRCTLPRGHSYAPQLLPTPPFISWSPLHSVHFNNLTLRVNEVDNRTPRFAEPNTGEPTSLQMILVVLVFALLVEDPFAKLRPSSLADLPKCL